MHFFLLQKRHRADDEINHRNIDTFRDGTWGAVQWQNLRVGDIVRVMNNTFFPADLVLLSSRLVSFIYSLRSHMSVFLILNANR